MAQATQPGAVTNLLLASRELGELGAQILKGLFRRCLSLQNREDGILNRRRHVAVVHNLRARCSALDGALQRRQIRVLIDQFRILVQRGVDRSQRLLGEHALSDFL